MPAAALVTALALGWSGCSALGDGEPRDDARSDVVTDVVTGIQRALDRRAAALRGGDRVALERGLVRDPAFRAEQAAYLANLAQLPVGRLRYTLDRATLVRRGDGYWVVVEEHLRLDGYDARPVVSRDRYRFRPAPGRAGRFLLASVTDPAWERQTGSGEQPWAVPGRRVQVRRGAGVLGIFDAGSVRAAGPLLSSVERGIADVAGVVPYDWDRTVVVYALSDPRFLEGLTDLPEPAGLDAVTFQVPTAPGSERTAATRFVLSPRLLDRPGGQRDRLVRHELAHVALGTRDDAVPVWLAEGIAEYVSVRAVPPEERRVVPEAVAAARAGLPGLPADENFHGAGSATHYAVSWWACEYLARSHGEPVLWTLLEQMAAPGADPDATLERLLGIDRRTLARRAGGLLLATYGP